MEDAKIVELYWARSQRAISETASKYGNYCTSIAKNILGNYEDAEECVNDTYMKTWNSLPPHRPQMLSTFLGKITRNLSFNQYKMKHADKRGGYEIPIILDELSECVSGHDDVEKMIEYKAIVGEINAFLRELSREKRNIFIYRYWYSISVTDIAQICGMKENTVSMILSRTRKKLREYLTERGYEI